MEKKSHQSLRCQSITNLYQILRRKKTISVSSFHLNVLQSLMIVLYPINQILFLILVDHPFNSKTRIIFKNWLQTETFLNNWKQSNVVPILKKVTRNCCKIVAHSRCCQYVVKFLKELSSTQCWNFLKKIISVHTNLDFVYVTHVKASYYPLFMPSKSYP